MAVGGNVYPGLELGRPTVRSPPISAFNLTPSSPETELRKAVFAQAATDAAIPTRARRAVRRVGGSSSRSRT